MKIRVATLVANFLAERGVRHVFGVTGGGAMHLNDAIGHHEGLRFICNHHEQASAMAAEGYARIGGMPAAVCVTSGPGGTNAITGVLGAYLDSIPMIVISGQVKRETTVFAADLPLRQLGDQEYDIVASVARMTKYAQMIVEPRDVLYHLEKAWYLATHGRFGPVWLDIPIDVQSAEVETDTLTTFDEAECGAEEPILEEGKLDEVAARLSAARRPVVLVGTGVRRARAKAEMLALAERLGAPLLTAWNAHDLVPDEHPLYCGRPGSVGLRGGNFVLQNADLLLVLGCRLNVRQIGYHFSAFAKNAYKIVVDIDRNELKKPTVRPDIAICADVKDFLLAMLQKEFAPPRVEKFLAWARQTHEKYPAVTAAVRKGSGVIDPYRFTASLTRQAGARPVVCANGTACVVTFQAAVVGEQSRLFTNSGCASMGYGLPAAIGAAFATRGDVICIEGDGSIQMNLQELQTVVHYGLPLKIFVLNNGGYHSIRQSQRNARFASEVGVDAASGVSFPDLERIAAAYGIAFARICDEGEMESDVSRVLSKKGAVLCEVMIDPAVPFAPKVAARVETDGSITSPPLDDMWPYLSREEYATAQYEP